MRNPIKPNMFPWLTFQETLIQRLVSTLPVHASVDRNRLASRGRGLRSAQEQFPSATALILRAGTRLDAEKNTMKADLDAEAFALSQVLSNLFKLVYP